MWQLLALIAAHTVYGLLIVAVGVVIGWHARGDQR